MILLNIFQHDSEVTHMATLHAEVPQQIWQQAQNMVDRGWAANIDSLVVESLRRYLESHQETMTEQFIMEDVEWGLRGHD
jgi:hypothetical protein